MEEITMKNISMKSNLFSALAGIALAIFLGMSMSSMPKVEAEEWCPPPTGCNFTGCQTKTNPTRPDTRVCKFRDVNGGVCGGSPACGTAPTGGGGGGGGPEIEVDPEN
jgi:hypothetical protein